jgi:ubiquitin C-terminal hydrolase
MKKQNKINRKQFDLICSSIGGTLSDSRKTAAYEVIISGKDELFAGADNNVSKEQLEDDLNQIQNMIDFVNKFIKLGK